MEKNKKKSLTMMKALLLIALVPTLVSVLVTVGIGTSSMRTAMEDAIYHELYVAAEGLREYYLWDINNSEEHKPTYEHD